MNTIVGLPAVLVIPLLCAWPRAAQPAPGRAGPPPARSVVFLCDASAGAKAVFPGLQSDLGKAIDRLTEAQMFDVVLMRDGKPLLAAPRLRKATVAAKKEAKRFVGLATAAGKLDAVPALRTAFELKPQLLYFMLAGGPEQALAARDEARKLNRKKLVKINVIALVEGDELDEALVTHMKSIAQENGGIFRLVRLEDLKEDVPAPRRRLPAQQAIVVPASKPQLPLSQLPSRSCR